MNEETGNETGSGVTVNDRRRFKDEAASSEPPPEKPGQSEVPEPEARGPEVSEPEARGPEVPEPEARGPEVSEPTPGADEDTESGEEEEAGAFPEISTLGILNFALGSFSQLAWQNMGLRANLATGKVEKNLEEARIAIDAFAALLPIAARRADDRVRRELQTELNNLRLNFVEQSGRAG